MFLGACVEISRFFLFFNTIEVTFMSAPSERSDRYDLKSQALFFCYMHKMDKKKTFPGCSARLESGCSVCVLFCVFAEKVQLLWVKQNISHDRTDEFSRKKTNQRDSQTGIFMHVGAEAATSPAC